MVGTDFTKLFPNASKFMVPGDDDIVVATNRLRLLNSVWPSSECFLFSGQWYLMIWLDLVIWFNLNGVEGFNALNIFACFPSWHFVLHTFYRHLILFSYYALVRRKHPSIYNVLICFSQWKFWHIFFHTVRVRMRSVLYQYTSETFMNKSFFF